MISKVSTAVSFTKINQTAVLENSFERFGRYWNREKKGRSKTKAIPVDTQEKKSRTNRLAKAIKSKTKKRKVKPRNEQTQCFVNPNLNEIQTVTKPRVIQVVQAGLLSHAIPTSAFCSQLGESIRFDALSKFLATTLLIS